MDQPAQQDTSPAAGRRLAMSLLARSTRAELEACWQQLCGQPHWRDLRQPESGMVMVRGRMGGDGRSFNVGEVTVTRSTVVLDDGLTGSAYVLGRDKTHARLAALFDALWQGDKRAHLERMLLAPIAERIAANDRQNARESAATKVDFYTLVRGED